jgi:hypothetical protein
MRVIGALIGAIALVIYVLTERHIVPRILASLLLALLAVETLRTIRSNRRGRPNARAGRGRLFLFRSSWFCLGLTMELAARNAGGPAANSMINEARRGGVRRRRHREIPGNTYEG